MTEEKGPELTRRKLLEETVKAVATVAIGGAAILKGGPDSSKPADQHPEVQKVFSVDFITSPEVDAFLKKHRQELAFDNKTGNFTVLTTNMGTVSRGPGDLRKIEKIQLTHIHHPGQPAILTIDYIARSGAGIEPLRTYFIREQAGGGLTIDGDLDK